MSTGRVLVIDDDADMGTLVADVAKEFGFEARSVTRNRDFEEAYGSFAPTVLFIDLVMPDTDGIQILNYLHRSGCEAEIFMISGFDERVLRSARDFGLAKGLRIREALQKPIDIDVLERALGSIKRPGAAVSIDEIRKGLERGEFFPRYQPKLNLGTGGSGIIDGAEALVRWRHPDHGELAPGRFIAAVESEGLMPQMADLMMESVVAQMKKWAADGRRPVVAVNLSPSLLGDLTLPDRYEALVKENGVNPADLTVEITESAVMADVASTTEILTRFRLKGFGLSIDDFGTGYSSLVELYRMPFSELKVDQAFVGKVPGDKEAEVIVRLLVRLAHDLGLSVCAEGAEETATLTFLQDLGCEKVQGYVIDKPLLAEEFAERIGTTGQSDPPKEYMKL